MSRLIPFGQIPDSLVFPEHIYRLAIDKIEETQTKEREGKVQKLMFRVTSKVVEPAAQKGLQYTEFFVIGTDEDPEAEQLSTWQTSIGGRGFKKLTTALAIPRADEEDSEAFFNQAKGCEYLATIVQKTEPAEKNGVPNQYAGQVRNNVSAYWKIGDKDVGPLDGKPGVAPAKRAAKPAAVIPAEAKPAPSEELTCVVCKKRVPRKDMRKHVDGHMAEQQQGGEDDE